MQKGVKLNTERIVSPGPFANLHIKPTYLQFYNLNFSHFPGRSQVGRQEKMGAGTGEGEGSGRGGSPLWMVVWFLLLWFIGETVFVRLN